MLSFEGSINSALQSGAVAGSVIVAGDAKGNNNYAKTFGVRSLKDKEPLSLDSVYWIASATKLMSAIAALQCVERGLFTLDEDVTRFLGELKDIEILKGFDETTDAPILVKAKNKITLRHLLTHTSGLMYDCFDPMLTKWRKSRGEGASLDGGSLVWRCTTPLLFEPGESYTYSTGLDWAGLMVARANHTTLEAYMEANIWAPLGIKNIAFHLDKRPDMRARLAALSERQGGSNNFGGPADPSGAMAYTDAKVWDGESHTDVSGGAGAYASASDFQKVLQSLTVDDGKLLTSASLEGLFTPQLGAGPLAKFQELNGIKEFADISAAGIPIGTKVSHGLGGMVLLEDLPGRRRKGTLSWQGLPNFYWFVDRQSGINGVYANQVIPCGDPQSLALFEEFEKDLYKSAGVKL